MHIMTAPQTLGFLDGQVRYMAEHGFEITAISSPGPFLTGFAAREPVHLITVDMPRRITPFQDLIALIHLVRMIRVIRPDIVHAHTPKGGLLGMLAARVAGVPVRIYHMHGLPFMTATGFRRRLLTWSERVSCVLAHRVLCVSHVLRQYAIEQRLCAPDKIVTPLGGSVNGVDALDRFNPDHPVGDATKRRNEIRARHEIPDEALVIAFIGRLVRDKGIVELADAWRVLADRHADLYLLMAGPFEPQDPVPGSTRAFLESHSRIHLLGQTDDVRGVLAASDVLVLPTYREGMPTAPLEAGSMRLPVVATRVSGCVEAVEDGVTGILVPVGDASALAEALELYINDRDRRLRDGEAGRTRVLKTFARERIWNATLCEYVDLLASRTRPPPVEGAKRSEPVVPLSEPMRQAGLSLMAKRAIDVAIAGIALVLLAPLLGVVALVILLTTGRPVLFTQTRPGRGGVPFRLVKFRTMRQERSASVDPQLDAIRMTRVGSLLRATSLDELPELWNVLLGTMSLVGPRPLLMQYLPLYTKAQARRHEVMPGLTGWAQVNGRNATTWEDRFARDIWYVDHWSVWLDTKILLLTVSAVLGRHGVSQEGYATMPEFQRRAVPNVLDSPTIDELSDPSRTHKRDLP